MNLSSATILYIYDASHCLDVPPQSGAKQFFYCTVYNITLNSNCEAQRASKNLKKCRISEELEAKKNAWVIWVSIFYFLKEKNVFKCH